MPIQSVGIKSKILFYMLLAGVIACFYVSHRKGQVYRSFQRKIEDYLCDLFPHSSNANYARANLPVANQVRT